MNDSRPPESVLLASESLDGKVQLDDLQFHPAIVTALKAWLDQYAENLLQVEATDIPAVVEGQVSVLLIRQILKLPQTLYDQQKAETKASAEAQRDIPEQPGSAGWPLKR